MVVLVDAWHLFYFLFFIIFSMAPCSPLPIGSWGQFGFEPQTFSCTVVEKEGERQGLATENVLLKRMCC